MLKTLHMMPVISSSRSRRHPIHPDCAAENVTLWVVTSTSCSSAAMYISASFEYCDAISSRSSAVGDLNSNSVAKVEDSWSTVVISTNLVSALTEMMYDRCPRLRLRSVILSSVVSTRTALPHFHTLRESDGSSRDTNGTHECTSHTIS